MSVCCDWRSGAETEILAVNEAATNCNTDGGYGERSEVERMVRKISEVILG